MSRKGDRKRLQILRFIAAFVGRCGYAPTVREITTGTGGVGIGATFYHLNLLEEQGRIRRAPDRPRAMQLLLTPGVVTVPVVWCEPCGVELPADHFCPARRAEFEHGSPSDLYIP